jgi:hypothetical protein
MNSAAEIRMSQLMKDELTDVLVIVWDEHGR